MQRNVRLAAALMLGALPLSALAQDAREATLAESLSRHSIRAAAISPDARSVAYLQSRNAQTSPVSHLLNPIHGRFVLIC